MPIERIAESPVRPRVLLIAPHGSYRTGPFLTAAAALGVDITLASEGRHSVIGAYAEGVHIEFSDSSKARQALLDETRRRPVLGVVGSDDGSTELAAMLARDLALPHNEPTAVRIARRKDLARQCLTDAGVRVPRFRRIDTRRALTGQMPDFFPCVLKPLAMAASRGVIRADDPREFHQACQRIAAITAEAEDDEERYVLLAERYIPGSEIAVEGLLRAGELQLLAIFDKPDPLEGPFFEETYYVTPSRLPDTVQQQVRSSITAACHAYGLREGPIHAECRLNQAGVWILEVAARTIGGLCARLLRLSTGHSLEELVLLHALNRPIAVTPSAEAAGVLMIPIPKAGILRRVEGIGAANAVPFVEEVLIDVREGYELLPLPEGASYLGFIFARAPQPAQAEAALRAAHACLNIVVAPLWKGLTCATPL